MNARIFDFISDDRTEFFLNLTIDPCILNTVFSSFMIHSYLGISNYLGTSTMI